MSAATPIPSVIDLLVEARLIPVITIQEATEAESVARALKAGGLRCAEIMLRTDAAEDAIRIMSQDEDMLVGAGTVLSPDQVLRATSAGARFIVTPGFTSSIVRVCKECSVPAIPGAVTATEITAAIDEGISVVKFFPASTMGGPAALRALEGPFPMVRFIPTGGVTAENMVDYLRLTCVAAVGGSWVVSPELLEARNYAEVTRRVSAAVALVAGM